jgi:hypothetical protein
MVLYSLEKAVLEAFRAANLEIAPALGEQLQDAALLREITNRWSLEKSPSGLGGPLENSPNGH